MRPLHTSKALAPLIEALASLFEALASLIEALAPNHIQSCSVSTETIDLIVTRWTLSFKSATIIILRRTKASMW